MPKLVSRIKRSAKSRLRNAKLFLKDFQAGRQLKCVQDCLDQVGPQSILLFACLRNEKFRLPFFCDYYRRLGVSHFVFVDNDSNDGFSDWAAGQPDVSVWHTTASYKHSAFGMRWLNDLLRRHGTGHWCVVVDPDEFLVYPYMRTRSLRALTGFLEEEKRPCMHAVMLDAYSDRPLPEAVLGEGQSPFDVCPYFDGDGYVQTLGWGGGVWVRGGPRLRELFADSPETAPAVNKIPLIKWQANYHYRMSMHDAFPTSLNRAHARGEVSITGALFHFKFVSQLQHKASEEMTRGEHYAGSREYQRYHDAPDTCYYDPDVSERYESPEQLIRLGLMSPGKWF